MTCATYVVALGTNLTWSKNFGQCLLCVHMHVNMGACIHVYTHTYTHINPKLHTMPKAKDIRVKSGWTQLFWRAESSVRMQNCIHFRIHLSGSFILFCFCLFIHFLFFFLALLDFLSPLTVPVNYIWEFRGMRPQSQCIKRPLFYFLFLYLVFCFAIIWAFLVGQHIWTGDS